MIAPTAAEMELVTVTEHATAIPTSSGLRVRNARLIIMELIAKHVCTLIISHAASNHLLL